VRQLPWASRTQELFHGPDSVDFAGLAVNLEEARRLADEFGPWIIEDSCHSPGGFLSTPRAASSSSAANGGFRRPSHLQLTPAHTGEGGMITTSMSACSIDLLRFTVITHHPRPGRPARGPTGGRVHGDGEAWLANYRLPDSPTVPSA
jgi:hypothetical protein